MADLDHPGRRPNPLDQRLLVGDLPHARASPEAPEVEHGDLALLHAAQPELREGLAKLRLATFTIDARNVGVEFGVEGGKVLAVRDVSFQLYRGETIAIILPVQAPMVCRSGRARGCCSRQVASIVLPVRAAQTMR